MNRHDADSSIDHHTAATTERERHMAHWLRRAFETDVTAAQHEDAMTDEDWLTLARKALEIADDPGW